MPHGPKPANLVASLRRKLEDKLAMRIDRHAIASDSTCQGIEQPCISKLNVNRLAFHPMATLKVVAADVSPASFPGHADWLPFFTTFHLSENSIVNAICQSVEALVLGY